MKSSCLQLLLFFIIICPQLQESLWWSSGNRPLMNHDHLCRRTRRFKGPLQTFCRREPDVISAALNGSKAAMSECRYQFRNDRWNCTNHKKFLKKILMKDVKETAVLNSMMAAGVTYFITRGCSTGDLSSCSCQQNWGEAIPMKISTKNKIKNNHFKKKKRYRNMPDKIPIRRLKQAVKYNKFIKTQNSFSDQLDNEVSSLSINNIKNPEVEYRWSGCSDNINYGYKKSKRLMDGMYRRTRRDTKTLVMLHNNEVGRQAIKNSMRVDCTCHGPSGACSFKTCWNRMTSFREIGEIIKNNYLNASKVTSSNDGKRLLLMNKRTSKQVKPKKNHLVYLEDSPDFCTLNKKYGSLGTSDRVCNSTANSLSSCEIMCCGRPYRSQIIQEERNCRCRFEFCCKVTCDTCRHNRTITYCT